MKPPFLFLFLLLVLFAFAQLGKDFEKVTYQNPYKFKHEIEAQLETDTVPWKYQIAATEYALKSDYQMALDQWKFVMPELEKTFTTHQVDSIHDQYTEVNAVSYITEQAKSHQVVIINEAHHNSFHRVFTTSFLKKLYDQGYRNLGLEGLGNGDYLDDSLMLRNYPVQATGYYTKDPQFGNLIRTAIEIGYHVFPYEATTHVSGKAREIAQAKNIQKEMEKRPNEKFLIHCGFDHVLEGKNQDWGKSMAGRLTEYLGIDPLTIHQVNYAEGSAFQYHHPMLKALNVKTSTVLVDKKKEVLRYTRNESWADIVVIHPITQYAKNRPNWLFTNGNKQVKIKFNNLDISFPIMVLAFKTGEDIQQAVPMDIIELEQANATAFLALKKGNYQLVAINAQKEARKVTLKVK